MKQRLAAVAHAAGTRIAAAGRGLLRLLGRGPGTAVSAGNDVRAAGSAATLSVGPSGEKPAWFQAPKRRSSSVWARPMGPCEPYARVFVLAALALTTIGIVSVFSASAATQELLGNEGTRFLKKQSLFAAVGAGLIGLAMRVDLTSLRKYAKPLLIATLVLLALLLVPGSGLAPKVKGARRWLRLGPISVQASEIAKLTLVLWLAHHLSRTAGRSRDWLRSTLPAVLPVGAACFLVIVEPDFGTAVFLAALGLVMMLIGGVPWPRLLYLGILSLPVVAWQVAKRWDVFAHRFAAVGGGGDASGSAAVYQVQQGLMALGNGGLFGQGLGAGRQKLFYLPEARTDFILPVVGEELGLIGTSAVVLLFVVLLLTGLRVALTAARRDRFGFLLTFGLVFWIGLQAVGNVAVVTASVPTKGIALPFVSFGGSSLLMLCAAVGLVYAVAHRVDRLGAGQQSSVRRATRPATTAPAGIMSARHTEGALT